MEGLPQRQHRPALREGLLFVVVVSLLALAWLAV